MHRELQQLKRSKEFPPEPNGYIHIGSAYAIHTNYTIAQRFNGTFHLRFDDTNPLKEDIEYVNAIIEDIKWLGYDPGNHIYYGSNYSEEIYNAAVTLIKHGKAYVCDLAPEEITEHRGTLTEPGRNSPYRNRLVEETWSFLRNEKWWLSCLLQGCSRQNRYGLTLFKMRLRTSPIHYAQAGVSKIVGAKQVVELFKHLGLTQWFRVVTGFVQLVAVAVLIIGYWYPGTVAWAGIWLGITVLLACLTHFKVKDPISKTVLPFVLAVIPIILIFINADVLLHPFS